MKRIHAIVMVTVITAFAYAAWAAEAPPAATGGTTAKATIQKVLDDVLAVLRNAKLSKPDRSKQIETIAESNLDFDAMARMSLGAPWRTISDAQKKSFSDEFKRHVINTYRHTTDDYTDEDIKLAGDRAESNGDATVQTTIIGTNDNGTRGEVAKVEYRLRKRGDTWKIIDVTIDGVSLVVNFREQFQAIIAGGNVDKLTKLLHDKNAEAEKSAGK